MEENKYLEFFRNLIRNAEQKRELETRQYQNRRGLRHPVNEHDAAIMQLDQITGTEQSPEDAALVRGRVENAYLQRQAEEAQAMRDAAVQEAEAARFWEEQQRQAAEDDAVMQEIRMQEEANPPAPEPYIAPPGQQIRDEALGTEEIAYGPDRSPTPPLFPLPDRGVPASFAAAETPMPLNPGETEREARRLAAASRIGRQFSRVASLNGTRYPVIV